MIRGITFDWWHTLAETPWPDFDERMRRLRVERIHAGLASLGLPLPEAALYRAYDLHTDHLVSRWKEHIDPLPAEQVDAFLHLAELDGEESARSIVERAFGEAIQEKLPILYPHVREVLARLKADGYAIGLVSNTGRTWGRFLRPIQDAFGIGRFFDARVFSDEVGASKPDARIFEVALEALGLPPGEVVHVGDDVEADVAGAMGLGMRAVWFNTGLWAGAKGDGADAEIADHADLPGVLARWSP